MIESELTVDMGTAVYWSKCLRKIEGTGGELTEALQKTFPPDWNAHHSPEANYESDIESDIDDEPSNDGDNNMFLAGVNDGDSEDDIDDHDENKDFKQRLWV
jgi:hypothetical protein